MSQIPIKKGKFSPQEIAQELRVNLQDNQVLSNQKQPSRRWLSKWLFLIIVAFLIIISSGLNYYFLISQKHAFADLIPENALAHVLVNQTDIYPQVAPFNQVLKERSFFGQEVINRLGYYFNQAELSFSQEIQPLFKDQMIFILLPSNSETNLPFLVVLEKNQGLAEISQILDKLRPELNKDFNLSSQNYRQIEIVKLEPLNQYSIQYFYAQVENHLIITNSQEELSKILDSIINS